MQVTANLIGQRFDKLVVVAAVPMPRRRLWRCICDCGKEKLLTTGNLRGRSNRSCGCGRYEFQSASFRQHGHARARMRTKEYRAWAHMLGRCNNPTDSGFADYGARGIAVDPRWAHSFEAFLEDMGLAPSPSHSLDRIDCNGNYEPGNCRWATAKVQARNTRRARYVNGKNLADVCEEQGLKIDTVRTRLRRGDPIELAISTLRGHAYRAMIAAAPSTAPDVVG